MKAGFYAADITPARGMERPGGYDKAYIEEIRDPIKARASVFDDGMTQIAFVGVDTCMICSRNLIQWVRSEVERLCGIPAENIMISASHTHSGGPLGGLDTELFDDASDLVKFLVCDYSTTRDRFYESWVSGQIVTAVCEAHRRRQDAKVSIGSGFEDRVSYNRRIRMKNGRVYTHPTKGNPDSLDFAGPIDPEVGVVAAWTPTGELIGCMVNFACHCTTLYGPVSADYVEYLERTIQGAVGKEATVVFLQGASGDVGQFDNMSTREPEFGEKYCRYLGMRLGGEVVKVMAETEPGEHSPLAATSTTLHIRRRKPSAARVAESRRIVEDGLRSGTMDTRWSFAKEILILDHLADKCPEVEVEVQGLQIGEHVFLANPAELFCSLGLAIKHGSPFKNTHVVELANGCIGYVPTENAFASDGGGYETVLTSYSNLDIKAGNMLVDASLEIAMKLQPGYSPRVPDISTSDNPWAKGTPWDLGMLGPELE